MGSLLRVRPASNMGRLCMVEAVLNISRLYRVRPVSSKGRLFRG